MKDVFHRAVNWIDHNRYTVISLVLFAAMMALVSGVIGCASRTPGVLSADPVPRAEFDRQVLLAEKDFTGRRLELEKQMAVFNADVAAFNEQIAAGYADLERQDAFRGQVLDAVSSVVVSAADGTLNPAATIPLGLGLLGLLFGLGKSADNSRKDAVIAALKTDAGKT